MFVCLFIIYLIGELSHLSNFLLKPNTETERMSFLYIHNSSLIFQVSFQEREEWHLIPILEILQARGQDSHVMFSMIEKPCPWMPFDSHLYLACNDILKEEIKDEEVRKFLGNTLKSCISHLNKKHLRFLLFLRNEDVWHHWAHWLGS